LHHLVHQADQVKGLELQTKVAVLDAGDIQQAVDQGCQAIRLAHGHRHLVRDLVAIAGCRAPRERSLQPVELQ
jgi:hypothetical protein